MFPVAVHEAAVTSEVEDGEDAWGVALGPDESEAALLEVADGDAAVHPLIASSKAAPASAEAKRWVVLPG
jgi:hypothetical protein